MTSKIGEIYQKTSKAYKECHSSISIATAQQNFNVIWKEKVGVLKKKEEKEKTAGALLAEWREKATTKKSQNILSFFKKQIPSQKSSAEPTRTEPSYSTGAATDVDAGDKHVLDLPGTSSSVTKNLDSGKEIGNRKRPMAVVSSDEEEIADSPANSTLNRSYKTPIQDALRKEIAAIKVEIQALVLKKNAGLNDDSANKELKALEKKLKENKSELRVKEQSAKRQKKLRDHRKERLAQAMLENPNLGTQLGVREESGRPRLGEDQPELLKAIVELVPFGAGAEDRRRSEVLRSCRKLSDLHKELEKMGFHISRSAIYLRLLPKKQATHEGKKHIVTVPVRLLRPQADLHKVHIDQNFCKATIRSIETLTSILGPDQVIFISQDDKARVPLGITAVNKQAPVLMHLDYQIRLPDHDWVVAERHKLVPSVYAYIVIKPDCMGEPTAVSYSGPTYIAIRSGKHSSSTASTHAADFERLLSVQSFQTLMKNEEGVFKPVLVLSVDGGPDENPRYPKVIAHAVDRFKKHDLDALFIFTNAPGRSAYNRVERRMAALSKELAGVVLDHEHFGSHLNANAKTVDPQLEIQNFAHAGEVLADVWNGIVLDGHDVFAEYIHPGEALSVPDLPQADWYAQHVRESQYFLQIVKCTESACCKEARSGLRRILPDGFLPPPYSLVQTAVGPKAPQPMGDGNDKFAPLLLRLTASEKPNHVGFTAMPYDFFCPSICDQLRSRTCKICGLYSCSKKAAAHHRRMIHISHSKSTSANKVSVRRVITRRQGELLCQVAPDTMEWVAEEDAAIATEDVIAAEADRDSDSDSDLPLIECIKKWNRNPFIDD